ncbi:MAG: leucyl/phenylalanyl-tRNA--protein transferase [Betaproteobacteria bacterium]|nr:leucyl/phenylalanyl-tRNA--protein transferase [Betaproteobacteria bacterium]
MLPSELTPEIVLFAYGQGCFPMPDPSTGNINWYRPDPRAVIPLEGFHVGRTLKRVLSKQNFTIRTNNCFEKVMRACAAREDTWITEDFIRIYGLLNALGFAHSLEVFHNDELVGGVYGVSLGGAFFAESMFHATSNASKVALFYLVEHLKKMNFVLLECQFLTPHLASLGAIEISDHSYMSQLASALELENVAF